MEVDAVTGLLLVLVLLFAGSCGPGAEPGGSPPVTTRLERPAWLDEEPIIIVGGWDDMPRGFLHAGQKRSRFSGTRSNPSSPSTTRIN